MSLHPAVALHVSRLVGTVSSLDVRIDAYSTPPSTKPYKHLEMPTVPHQNLLPHFLTLY
jgi:hypothetical protein